jgi:hypothetical protein
MTISNNRDLCALLCLLLIIAVLFAASPVDAMNPVMMSFYRRQQCERSFQMCQMAAMGESHFEFTTISSHLVQGTACACHPALLFSWQYENLSLVV